MIVDSYLTLKLSELSKGEWRKLRRKLTYTDADRREWECWRPLPSRGEIRLPRGAWNLLPGKIEYTDRRVCPYHPERDFKRELDATLPDGRSFEGQVKAVRVMMEQEQGLIVAQPGFGKTNVALAFCAVIETNALILVHTEDILQQWISNIQEAIPDAKIGVIRGDEESIGDITVSTVQTFHRKLNHDPKRYRKIWGCVILDEAHHAAAKTFEQILNQMWAKYRFGFTASPTRADGKHPYMKFVIGPIIYRSKFKSKVPLEIRVVNTGFKYRWRGAWDWGNLLRALTTDSNRNALIASMAARDVRKGHTTLVLSRNIEHLESLRALIPYEAEILTGKRKKKDRARIISDFRAGKLKLVLATQLADEALDIPILARVHLTFPGKHDGRIIQQIGRSVREHHEKENAVVYDYFDKWVSPLRKQYLRRRQTYRTLHLKVRKGRKVK